MKLQFLPLLTLVFSIANANAQTNKGAVMIGGTVSFNQNKAVYQSQEAKSRQFTISPAIGKAVREDLLVGINLRYSNGSNDNLPYDEKYSGNTFGSGLFLRKYWPIGKRFYIFGQTNLDFLYTKGDYENKPTNTTVRELKQYSIIASIDPGVTFAVSPRLHIDLAFNQIFSAGYSKSEEKYTNNPSANSEQSSFSSSANLSVLNNLLFGFRFFITSRKQ